MLRELSIRECSLSGSDEPNFHKIHPVPGLYAIICGNGNFAVGGTVDLMNEAYHIRRKLMSNEFEDDSIRIAYNLNPDGWIFCVLRVMGEFDPSLHIQRLAFCFRHNIPESQFAG